MTGCRILLIFTLLLGLAAPLSAAPLIVQVSPLASISSIAAVLAGAVIDSIPGANIYLLEVPVVPSTATASLLGIQWMELNQGIALAASPIPVVLTVPPSTIPDWYKSQPPLLLMHAGDALPYSRGRGIVV